MAVEVLCTFLHPSLPATSSPLALCPAALHPSAMHLPCPDQHVCCATTTTTLRLFTPPEAPSLFSLLSLPLHYSHYSHPKPAPYYSPDYSHPKPIHTILTILTQSLLPQSPTILSILTQSLTTTIRNILTQILPPFYTPLQPAPSLT